jgi:hypothetical protein
MNNKGSGSSVSSSILNQSLADITLSISQALEKVNSQGLY